MVAQKIITSTNSLRFMRYLFIVAIAVACCWTACKKPQQEQVPVESTPVPVKVPAFSGDSAVAFIAKQVSFGPRVPGTAGHTNTRKWLVNQFKSYGASVREQTFTAKTASIGDVRAANIIASFNPTYARRVVLAAHWDTRYAADEDDQKVMDPIDGADDGGSGVGVLLEIARLIQQNPINIGVDIVLFDAEDQGLSEGAPESWCLGAQHWSQNLHVKGYRAEYGILLDMVGAKGAVFAKEDLSNMFTPEKSKRISQLYDKVWQLARGMGHSSLFIDQRSSPVTDDHLFVNMYTDIPMIDIIHRVPNGNGGFGPHWHTHDDNMEVIDPKVIQAVGQVVTAYVYNSTKSPS
jgi:glutaminyl-peptide cyclotransferase